jgi:signal transduction histidine kinase
MEQLIDDLLALARERQAGVEFEPVALDALGRSSWRSLVAEEASLVAATDAVIRADPDRLRQLLRNLFCNAIDHGGDDVTVTVGLLGDRPGFYVADDGHGIPEEEREQVFDHGYSTSDGGTGFGLSIVSRIADTHGWDVTVVASDDGGARFEVTGVDVRPAESGT